MLIRAWNSDANEYLIKRGYRPIKCSRGDYKDVCVRDYREMEMLVMRALPKLKYRIHFIAADQQQCDGYVSTILSWRLFGRVEHQKYLVLRTVTAWSVLGGAHATLGKVDRQHAYRAALIALKQRQLALFMGDEQMLTQSLIYLADCYLHIGRRLKVSKRLLTETSHQLHTQSLRSLHAAVLSKLNNSRT